MIFFILLVSILYYLMKHNINPLGRPSTFNVLEGDIKNYLKKRKEINEESVIEKEKIEILEKELDDIKVEIDKEIKDEK